MALWDKFLNTGDNQEKHAQELWARAQKYFEGKLYNRALKDLTDAIQLHPAYAAEALDLMQAFSMQGNDEQALSVGLALLKVENQNAQLMNKLGNVTRKLGSFPRAKKLHTMALKINPKMTDAKYNLAACSFGIAVADSELVRQTKAVEGYTEVRRYEFMGDRAEFFPIPNQVIVTEKGKHQEEEPPPDDDPGEEESEEARAQRIEMMAKQLKEDISASQGAWQDEFNLALFYDVADLGQLAIQHYQKAIEKAPDAPEPRNNLAVALMVHKEQYEAAEGMLLENLSQHRYDRTTVLNIAVLYRLQNKAFQTLKYYVYLGDLLAKSLGEFNTEKAEELAQELFTKRKYVEATPIFANLVKEKQEVYWYEKLAVMYYNQKKEDLYIRTLKDLLQLDPTNQDAAGKITSAAQAYEDEAREKINKGSKHHAISLLEKAVKIEETAERWVELAQLYKDDGEEILADNALKKWKKMSGQNEEVLDDETEDAQEATV